MHYKGTKDRENNGFRNADPASYITPIQYLISKGYTVVRLGDRVENLLPQMDGFVDYANSKFKSEEMDIYLITNCYFYLGTNSGIFDLAVLFRVPMVTVNVTEMLAAKPFHSYDVMIYKRIRRLSDGIILPMEDYLDLNAPPSLHEFEFLDNSSEDIIDAIDQMLNNLSKNRIENQFVSLKFEEKLKDTAEKWADLIFKSNGGPTYMNAEDEIMRIKSYSRFNGHIGNKFVSKYF